MAGSEASDTTQTLVQRLTPSLRRFARALSVDRDRVVAADEIVRTALDRVSLLPNESEAHLKTALYAGVILAHRSRRPSPANDSDNAAKAGRAGIAHLIERLPLDQREVLLLIVLEHLSYDDVATILALPRSSIVARLARARASLSLPGEETAQRPAYLRLVK